MKEKRIIERFFFSFQVHAERVLLETDSQKEQ